MPLSYAVLRVILVIVLSLAATCSERQSIAAPPQLNAKFQHALQAEQSTLLKLSHGDRQVVVRNCADWLSAAAAGYDAEDGEGFIAQTYELKCMPLLFFTNAPDAAGPAPPLALRPEDAARIPAAILPTLHTFSYEEYRKDNTNMAEVLKRGGVTIASTDRSALRITCTGEAECIGMSETLTVLGRGDFLHVGTWQLLIREDDENPGYELGNGFGLLLFVPGAQAATYQAELFSLACMKPTFQNLAALEAVPCVTKWPAMPNPPAARVNELHHS